MQYFVCEFEKSEKFTAWPFFGISLCEDVCTILHVLLQGESNIRVELVKFGQTLKVGGGSLFKSRSYKNDAEQNEMGGKICIL